MVLPLLTYTDWGLLLARVVLGLILLAHGLPKIKNLPANAQSFAQMGFKHAMFWGFVVAIIEFVGGIFIIFGLFTQIVALLVLIQFLVAIFKVKGKMGFVRGYEFDLLIAATALFLATQGGGVYGLDDYFGIIIYF